MKKFVTLVLALVMALAIALPAMAFTDNTTAPSNAVVYELDVYLVEYDGEFFALTAAPPSDRGYAKNEIVAAIVELYVPKDKDPFDSGYKTLEISGDNVNFAVTDAAVASTGSPAISAFTQVGTNGKDGWKYTLVNDALKGKNTFKWLFFAKVTGDDASITAELIDGDAPADITTVGTTFTLGGDKYTVSKSNYNYTVKIVDNEDYAGAEFVIKADKNGKTNGMAIQPVGYSSPVSLVPFAGTIGVMTGSSIVTSGSDYNKVMDIYEDIVVDVFGFDFNKIGNYINDSAFTGLTSSKTVSATVEIKPWTAYVTVPDNIVVDPPKTGDAASIVGFVMIVLAAAAVVAVKKVRA